MFFPIGDDQVKGGNFPFFSYALIVFNILVFLYQWSLPPAECNAFLIHYGSIPQEIIAGEDTYTLLSSMFLHGGFVHLLGNMLFLWVFADNIEATIGNVNFLLFYLLGGLIATGAHIAFNPVSPVPSVGASGAISAVLGAYLILFPRSRIRVLILFFFISVNVPALVFLGIWIIQQLFYGIGAIGAESAQTGGVAWWAHIGGFVFGVIAGLFMRGKGREIKF